MDERIFSIETEYAIFFEPDPDSTKPENNEIVDALRWPLIQGYGLPRCKYLVNGAKFDYDVGHAEYSLPECRSAREATVYDKAADAQLAQATPTAQERLAQRGYRGRLSIVKNNADTEGNTYGCHENYMALSESDWLGREDHLRLTIRYLIPFLVTRQLFCGAGRFGFGPRLEEGPGFQIMQRADFIDAVVSKETQKERAIVNISRENEPLATGNFRRLHLILADANMSGWATYLKLGVTGILLRMVEDLYLDNIPHLLDPLNSLRRISRDPSCRTRVPLRDGRALTAIEIQRLYLAQAQHYFDTHEASPEENEILTHWEETLSVLEKKPGQLFGKVDWITKKYLMDRYLERNGLTWNSDLRNHAAYYELLRMDIQYHTLAFDEGLFYRLLRGKSDSLITEEEIEQAKSVAPPFTRARVRGAVVAAARRVGATLEVDRWDHLRIGHVGVELGNPLDFFLPEVLQLLTTGKIRQHGTTVQNESAQTAALIPTPDIRAGGPAPSFDRSQYTVRIFASDATVGQQVAAGLVNLGYTSPELRSGAHQEGVYISWGSAADPAVEEVVDTICHLLGLPRTHVLRRPRLPFQDAIFVNLPFS